jgi:hypothetical protein
MLSWLRLLLFVEVESEALQLGMERLKKPREVSKRTAPISDVLTCRRERDEVEMV